MIGNRYTQGEKLKDLPQGLIGLKLERGSFTGKDKKALFKAEKGFEILK